MSDVSYVQLIHTAERSIEQEALTSVRILLHAHYGDAVPRTMPRCREHNEASIAEHIPTLLVVSPDGRVALGNLLDASLDLGRSGADMPSETALLETLERAGAHPHGYARRHSCRVTAVIPVVVGDEHAAQRLKVFGQIFGKLGTVEGGGRTLEMGQNGGVEGGGKVGPRT